MRVALIHDWLNGMRGGEKCLEELCALFPDNEVFTLFYQPENISAQISSNPVHASWLQRLPGVRRYYRHLLPFFPLGILGLGRMLRARHRARPFDAVISVSHCAVKNISVPPEVPHICYCLTPARYLWDQYDRYFKRSALEPLIRMVISLLRRWDVARSTDVDRYVAISEFIRKRIRTVYGCDADVIYPPVRTDLFRPSTMGSDSKRSGFLVVNALVPYKNTEHIVSAFNELNLPLTIVGRGPEESRLKKLAGPNITFKGFVTEGELQALYRGAEALVFAAEEDFGISPVEAQGAGCPVIAYGAGGALETISSSEPGVTGVFFSQLSSGAIKDAVLEFRSRAGGFTERSCVDNAQRFSAVRFRSEISILVGQLAGVPSGPRFNGESGGATLRANQS